MNWSTLPPFVKFLMIFIGSSVFIASFVGGMIGNAAREKREDQEDEDRELLRASLQRMRRGDTYNVDRAVFIDSKRKKPKRENRLSWEDWED